MLLVLADYHTHNSRCGHARGQIEEYVQAAVDLGLEEIGISDHAPIYWMEGDRPLPGSAMARSELPVYVAEVLELRRRYSGKVRVLLALEADYVPGFEAPYRELRSRYPFDYLIGSVHYCQGFHIYDPRRWNAAPDPCSVYAEYFRLVRESARSGLFEVLGHITGILACGPPVDETFLAREFAETAAVLAETGVAIEVNTSGLRKGLPEPFPAGALLQRCREAGVPLTYGSDAHQPSEVGYARDAAARLLERSRLWRPAAAAEPAPAGI